MIGTYGRLGVHVYASPREVIKAASRKLKKRVRYSRLHRGIRHTFYRAMLEEHAAARLLVQHFRL